MSVSARRVPWKRTIKLKDLLDGESDGVAVRQCARAMADRLKRERDYKDGTDDFSMLVEEFDLIAESTPEEYADEDWTILTHFNGVLSGLYDWADAERVWIA